MPDLFPVIIAAVAILVLIIIILTGYLKAPPDTAYIVSGLRRKVVIGKSCIKIPLFERLDKLSLKLIPIDVKTSNAVPTADYININVDAAVNVKAVSYTHLDVYKRQDRDVPPPASWRWRCFPAPKHKIPLRFYANRPAKEYPHDLPDGGER